MENIWSLFSTGVLVVTHNCFMFYQILLLLLNFHKPTLLRLNTVGNDIACSGVCRKQETRVTQTIHYIKSKLLCCISSSATISGQLTYFCKILARECESMLEKCRYIICYFALVGLLDYYKQFADT